MIEEDEIRKTRHCLICDKPIPVHGDWGYTHGKYFFCTYSHMREYETSDRSKRGVKNKLYCIINGERMTVAAACKEYGLSYSAMHKALYDGRVYHSKGKRPITAYPEIDK